MRRNAEQMEATGDRALELFEKRLPMFVISERLNVSSAHLGELIEKARERRKAREAASE